jgi:hypothetical protein
MVSVNISTNLLDKMIKDGIEYKYIVGHLPMGLYATKSYETNDVIITLTGHLSSYPSRESIHIGNNMHITDDYGQYINHSFEPNSKILLNKVIAIKPINAYTEITFNYNDSELTIANPFIVDGIEVKGKGSN